METPKKNKIHGFCAAEQLRNFPSLFGVAPNSLDCTERGAMASSRPRHKTTPQNPTQPPPHPKSCRPPLPRVPHAPQPRRSQPPITTALSRPPSRAQTQTQTQTQTKTKTKIKTQTRTQTQETRGMDFFTQPIHLQEISKMLGKDPVITKTNSLFL